MNIIYFNCGKYELDHGKKIIAVIDTTFSVVKRKPEKKNQACKGFEPVRRQRFRVGEVIGLCGLTYEKIKGLASRMEILDVNFISVALRQCRKVSTGQSLLLSGKDVKNN